MGEFADESLIADGPTPVMTPIDWHGELPSTNSEALRRATLGERGPVWIAAHRQTAGRGRSERRWQTLDGNLAASFLFAPECRSRLLPQLALVAGIAAHAALLQLLPSARRSSLQLKWPNDLLCGNAKLGGLLVEATTVDERLIAVLGFGLNLASAPQIEGRATICLADVAALSRPESVLSLLDHELRSALALWREGAGFSDVVADWLGRSTPIGTRLQVHGATGPVDGTFAGLAEDGALLLAGAGGTVFRMSHGDVDVLGGALNDVAGSKDTR
ncbi:MAG: biotin--[acetyl-CoA-carboxylase] ligase [Hyphomicrobiaceae bacterium]